ncbi:MAG: ATP phosphoribosyltransferase [Myxococcales bacterium]|nr:ATP phosphoribosyltransferase [Myxococcales bacterium]MCB9568664.1 ATP phosphoribosyltransferase [Myxococcales bacterium]MCB9705963.1 ATP phosphoribosyltransferase [Myxococcales bacterium]
MEPVAEPIAIALPKGRILEEALPLLARAGIDLEGLVADAGRRLLLPTPLGGRVLLVKPVDVPTYVEHGIADLGIAGLDTLAEEDRDLYEPVDLGIGACRLVVAEPVDRPWIRRPGAELRVATKYPRLALRHYRARGIQARVIQLFGSVELGAVTGLADQIVDLVESGETLRQNHLREVETILKVTSRLIVHPASLKLKRARIEGLIDALRDAVDPALTRTA